MWVTIILRADKYSQRSYFIKQEDADLRTIELLIPLLQRLVTAGVLLAV